MHLASIFLLLSILGFVIINYVYMMLSVHFPINNKTRGA